MRFHTSESDKTIKQTKKNMSCNFNIPGKIRINSGFTLMEVLVTVIIIGMIAMIATTVTLTGARDEECYDATVKIMENLNLALMGVPPTHIAGERRYMGYIADIGELPALIGKNSQPAGLWTSGLSVIDNLASDLPSWVYTGNDTRLWIGWHGPYVDSPLGGIIRDGWGNAIIFERFSISEEGNEIIDPEGPNIRFTSPGSDGIEQDSEDEETGYKADIEYVIRSQDYLGELAGYADSEVKGVTVYRPSKGILVSEAVKLEEDGYFVISSEKAIPMGTRSLVTTGEKNNTVVFSVEPAGNWLGTVK